MIAGSAMHADSTKYSSGSSSSKGCLARAAVVGSCHGAAQEGMMGAAQQQSRADVGDGARLEK